MGHPLWSKLNFSIPPRRSSDFLAARPRRGHRRGHAMRVRSHCASLRVRVPFRAVISTRPTFISTVRGSAPRLALPAPSAGSGPPPKAFDEEGRRSHRHQYLLLKSSFT